MRRVHVVALAVALAFAGCPGATSNVGTVTPAPVPTHPPSTEEPTPRPCDLPTPESPPRDGTLEPPTSVDTVPQENGTVNETALLARHDRELRSPSYHLLTPEYAVTAAPNGSAAFVSTGTSLRRVEHYVVDGWRYTAVQREGGRTIYDATVHEGGTFTGEIGGPVSLTGRTWLAEVLDVTAHRVVERRPDGWTVLREVRENRTTDGGQAPGDGDTATPETSRDGGTVADRTPDDGRAVRPLNSTVLVDRRGIVRSVDQRLIVEDDGTLRIATRSFDVTDVGATTVTQPSWVCDAVRDGRVGSG